MNDLLINPVYNALLTGDAHLASGEGKVRYYHHEVSPYAGFEQQYEHGFRDLHAQLPPGRRILHATPLPLISPQGWRIAASVQGVQFVLPTSTKVDPPSMEPVALNEEHIPEMLALATLTRPGPFDLRTIEFGHYYGFIRDAKLVAMTGQRLHVGEHTEISAVCTHPNYAGQGLAAALMLHQMRLIREQGKIPFLHVRRDNDRAVGLYRGLGFEETRGMNFYFMVRT